MPFVDFEEPKPQDLCVSPEHMPPSLMVLRPGRHTWECPNCGLKTTIYIPVVTC